MKGMKIYELFLIPIVYQKSVSTESYGNTKI